MNDLIQKSILALQEKKIPNPELDIRILLRHCCKNDKEMVLSNIDFRDIDIEYFKTLISKRLLNEPVSKIINKKSFWKGDFFVNSNVLDPRPETEIIIEETLYNFDKNKKIDILDIGTGSACIAISLAKELPNSKVIAIDISEKALKVAKKNIENNFLNDRITLKNTNPKNINKKFDLIVSNPPYISEFEYNNLDVGILKFEPKVALYGGIDGLDFYREIAKTIEKLMKPNSYFICEIGYNQLQNCLKIFKKTNLELRKISKDIQKIDRTLTFFKI